MKPVIEFRLPPASARAASTRELLTTIWPVVVDEQGSALDDAVVQSQPIRVGGEVPGQHAAVELPDAGTYLVDVAFPTGEHTRRTVVLADAQRYVFVLSDKGVTRQGVEPQHHTEYTKVAAAAAAALSLIGIQLEDLVVRRIRERMSSVRGPQALSTKVQAITRLRSDAEVVERVSSAAESRYTTLLQGGPDRAGRNYSRSWLLVSGRHGDDTLVSYPAEWPNNSSAAAFALTVYRTSKEGSGSDARWKAHLQLSDPVYGSVIECLARRDVASSVAILRGVRATASSMLYEKMDNPFAAAAGAYVVALGGDPDPDHDAWTRNLDERFPWLPDGAIAMGWKCLRRGRRGSTDWSAARDYFMRALSGGLPYYTVGVRLLLDGLTLLKMADPDEELRQAVAQITELDMACARNEPFTTVRLWRYRQQYSR